MNSLGIRATALLKRMSSVGTPLQFSLEDYSNNIHRWCRRGMARWIGRGFDRQILIALIPFDVRIRLLLLMLH